MGLYLSATIRTRLSLVRHYSARPISFRRAKVTATRRYFTRLGSENARFTRYYSRRDSKRPYQEHPQQQHQHDMHGCLCAAGGTCVSMAAPGSATSGGVAGAGSGTSVGVPGLPGGVNRCLAVHGDDPPCDPPTGSPLSIGTSTLICEKS